MDDVQNHPDYREVPINHVGVSSVRFPITVLDRANATQSTIAVLRMSVDLPQQFKGTHMSRFIEALNEHSGELTIRTLPTLLGDLRERLSAERARVEVQFPYFVLRRAPASKAPALMDYECRFVGELASGGDDYRVGVSVPVTSVCPCSKAISDYGAHNQRGVIQIDIRPARDGEGRVQLVWIEELIELAEGAASSPVYPLLKRIDERHVTMTAYDNPVFVEDMVRNVASRLRGDDRVASFRVLAENHESIHNHSAFAEVVWDRKAAAVDRHFGMAMLEPLGV